MSWLAGFRRPPSPDSSEFEPPPPERHAAPGLAQALAWLEGRPRRILDLGPPLHANLARLARLAPKLAVADLAGSLQDGLSPLAALDEALASLAPGGLAEPFELVLAWDLPNHLGRETLPRLGAQIARRCADGCLLHALLDVGKTMPALPRRYRIRDEEVLEQELLTAEQVACPRLQPGELDRLLPGFVIEKSRLLAHGVQEVLMKRTDHAEIPITRLAPVRRELRKSLPRGRRGTLEGQEPPP
jgi:hypothetical protein